MMLQCLSCSGDHSRLKRHLWGYRARQRRARHGTRQRRPGTSPFSGGGGSTDRSPTAGTLNSGPRWHRRHTGAGYLAILCLQNRGRTESTFENFTLSSGHSSAKVRPRPPVSAQCCGTLLLYRPEARSTSPASHAALLPISQPNSPQIHAGQVRVRQVRALQVRAGQVRAGQYVTSYRRLGLHRGGRTGRVSVVTEGNSSDISMRFVRL
jgi:hypothetical protein